MFENKIIVITGSTQGIGFRTAEILVSKGAKIVINSRSVDKVENAVKKLLLISPDIIGIAGDVSDLEFCIKLKNETINKFGKIDLLINNAGLASKGEFNVTDTKVYDMIFKVNVFGSIYPSKVFLPEIIKQKGGILFISSIAGVVGLPSYSAYSASKRAIVSLAESFKNELINEQVFIGINYPGFTENDNKKIIIDANGKEVFLKKRTEVKVSPLDKTVNCIINQIIKKKFRAYSTFSGRFVQITYRFIPTIALFVLKINRNKILKMQ
jgi:short-subunit dehydrogenase